jgi:hypothetical protein
MIIRLHCATAPLPNKDVTATFYTRTGWQEFDSRQGQGFFLLAEGSTPVIPKSVIGHDPEPVPSTSHPHNLIPWDPLYLPGLPNGRFSRKPHQNYVCMSCFFQPRDMSRLSWPKFFFPNNSSSCIILHCSLVTSHSDQDIFLSILLSFQIINLCSFLKLRSHVSRPYKTIGKQSNLVTSTLLVFVSSNSD